MPEWPKENFEYCVQGQGHSEGLKCQWMCVRILSSETQNILLPNLVWWCSIMSQCHAEGKKKKKKNKTVRCLQGQGHSKGSYDQNMSLSTISSELLILGNQTWSDKTSS